MESAQGAPRRGDAGTSLAFRDVASERGLAFRHAAFRFGVSADPAAMVGGGVCWLDADGDEWLDLFVVNGFSQQDRGAWLKRGGLPTSRLFRNEGGRFTDVTRESGAGLAVRGQGCVAADLDRDGDTDLFVTTAERNVLLWNDGDGTFSDGGKAAGVDAFGWYGGAAVGDVDGDGWPDLVVAGYTDMNKPIASATLGFPNTYEGRRDLLYLSNGGAEWPRDVQGGRCRGRARGGAVRVRPRHRLLGPRPRRRPRCLPRERHEPEPAVRERPVARRCRRRSGRPRLPLRGASGVGRCR